MISHRGPTRDGSAGHTELGERVFCDAVHIWSGRAPDPCGICRFRQRNGFVAFGLSQRFGDLGRGTASRDGGGRGRPDAARGGGFLARPFSKKMSPNLVLSFQRLSSKAQLSTLLF